MSFFLSVFVNLSLPCCYIGTICLAPSYCCLIFIPHKVSSFSICPSIFVGPSLRFFYLYFHLISLFLFLFQHPTCFNPSVFFSFSVFFTSHINLISHRVSVCRCCNMSLIESNRFIRKHERPSNQPPQVK